MDVEPFHAIGSVCFNSKEHVADARFEMALMLLPLLIRCEQNVVVLLANGEVLNPDFVIVLGRSGRAMGIGEAL